MSSREQGGPKEGEPAEPTAKRRRRHRGELVGPVRRLWPYLEKRKLGILALVLATLGWGGANAARAALLKELLNSVVLKGGPKDDLREHYLAFGVSDQDLSTEKGVAFGKYVDPNRQDAALDRDDLYMGGPPIPRGPASAALKKDDVAQLLQRTHKVILDCGEDLADRPQDKDARVRLGKAAAFQRRARELVEPDLLAASPATRKLAAALSLEARKHALTAGFAPARETLLWIFWAALGLAVLLGGFHFLMFYASRALVTKIVVDLQNRLAAHLLTLSIRYFNEERRGELFSRLTNDLNNVHSVLTMLLSDVVMQPLTLLVLVSAAFWVSPILASSLIVLSLTVFLPVRILGRKIRRSARERQASIANVLESMQQMFAGIRIVKAFRREPYEMQRFHDRTRDYLRTSLRVVRARTASKSWMEFVNDVTIPIVCLAGGALVVKNVWGLDAGKFAMFMALVLSMYMPAKTLAASYNTLQDSLPSVQRVFEVFDARPEIQDAPDAIDLAKARDAIRFEHVSFSYDGQREVLRDVTFTATVGQVTAIVGPTAAGKSTLVDLIARFYDPTNGRVTIDGVDLRGIKLGSLLDKVAVVTQEPFLFNDTIRENIRYGRVDATDAEIETAARAARIHDEILQAPGGYAANVGERGVKLSGGQRQRITIARAILKNPEILILDEATSALDTHTEKKVQEALEELEHGRTTFVIAHRLSTVKNAQRILVLEEGRLVEEGTHEELIALGGAYAGLVKRQELVPAASPPRSPGAGLALESAPSRAGAAS